MAERRMFSRSVVCTDAFSGLTHRARCLYFNLCLAADDVGVVASPGAVMRENASNAVDMKALTDSGYVVRLSSSLVLIRHWFMNNTIHSERMKPTHYAAALKGIIRDPVSRAYIMPGEEGNPAHEGASGTPAGHTAGTPEGTPESHSAGTPESHSTGTPDGHPTVTPDGQPSVTPDGHPVVTPDGHPTGTPDGHSTGTPDGHSTGTPDGHSTVTPDGQPSVTPDGQPSVTPDGHPTGTPAGHPTGTPDGRPNGVPSCHPTWVQDGHPNGAPSCHPTGVQDGHPTGAPSCHPTGVQDGHPTGAPACAQTVPVEERSIDKIKIKEKRGEREEERETTELSHSLLYILENVNGAEKHREEIRAACEQLPFEYARRAVEKALAKNRNPGKPAWKFVKCMLGDVRGEMRKGRRDKDVFDI